MPHSLKCKIKHLCHNGTITESERDRILKALEQEKTWRWEWVQHDTIPKADMVAILDKIRAEITEYAIPDFEYHGCGGSQKIVELEDVLEIIDKYKEKKENDI